MDSDDAPPGPYIPHTIRFNVVDADEMNPEVFAEGLIWLAVFTQRIAPQLSPKGACYRPLGGSSLSGDASLAHSFCISLYTARSLESNAKRLDHPDLLALALVGSR